MVFAKLRGKNVPKGYGGQEMLRTAMKFCLSQKEVRL